MVSQPETGSEAVDSFAAGNCDRRIKETPLTFLPPDPRPAPPRIRPDLAPQEDGAARVRWLAVRQLRPRPCRPRLPDRGAEDCQESAQGVPAEEEVDYAF